jgi:hypothetical protein
LVGSGQKCGTSRDERRVKLAGYRSAEQAINCRRAALQFTRDCTGFHAIIAQLPSLRRVEPLFAATIYTAYLGLLDPFALALLPDVEFEFGYSGQYAQHQLPVAGRRVEAALLKAPESNALHCQGGYDIMQILSRPGKSVEPGHKKRIALAAKIERSFQLRSVRCRFTADLFLKHFLDTMGCKLLDLNVE